MGSALLAGVVSCLYWYNIDDSKSVEVRLLRKSCQIKNIGGLQQGVNPR